MYYIFLHIKISLHRTAAASKNQELLPRKLREKQHFAPRVKIKLCRRGREKNLSKVRPCLIDDNPLNEWLVFPLGQAWIIYINFKLAWMLTNIKHAFQHH